MFRSKKPKREALRPQLVQVTEKLLRAHGHTCPVTLDAPLDERGLGLDSVERLELLGAIEQACGVQIPEVYWGTRPLRSLDHLLDVLCR